MVYARHINRGVSRTRGKPWKGTPRGIHAPGYSLLLYLLPTCFSKFSLQILFFERQLSLLIFTRIESRLTMGDCHRILKRFKEGGKKCKWEIYIGLRGKKSSTPFRSGSINSILEIIPWISYGVRIIRIKEWRIKYRRTERWIVNNRFGKRVSNGIWNAAPDSQL